ncbi:Cutinase [Nocardia amikacinitolerans]|uniref:cutinase family protein n=1 Tax=Nocardia amikacinitolerans TaxID=756689 RepID=UPI000AB4734E|nr:cutinase family protein [Nocardia amikacinitolerans]MCP2319177.1 Cutinase [Nocardia amikacinitolerans]
MNRSDRSAAARARVSVLLFSAMIALVTVIVPGSVVARAEAGCPAVAGVFLPGTWETNPWADESAPVGMLAPLATALSADLGDAFAFRFPAYEAAAFDRMPYGDSKATGVEAATRAIDDFGRDCPATKFVLAGYSQGADAMGDVAATIGCTGAPVAADRVLAVGLIADPRQGTGGATLVGPPVPGHGIAGPRPSGFCAVSAVTAQICATKDRYCSTDAATHPLLASLGLLLAQPTDADQATANDTNTAALNSLLASDFGDVRLAELPAAIDRLGGYGAVGPGATARIAAAAGGLVATLRPLRELAGWMDEHPTARDELVEGDEPERLAAAVLDGVARSDIGAALAVLDALAEPDREPATAASHAVDVVADATAPLLELVRTESEQALREAWRVLAELWPSVLIGRIASVAADTVHFAARLPAVGEALARLGAMIANGLDFAAVARELYDIVAQLNSAFAPLVRTVGDDLREVSRLLGLIPDDSGAVHLAAQLVRALAEIDAPALVAQATLLQDDLWDVVQAARSGAAPLDIAARAHAVLPTLLGFVTLAADDLAGAAGAELHRLTRDVLGAVGGQGPDAVLRLISEALSATAFVTSGAHQSYGHYVIDADGRTAVDWLAQWFLARARAG